MTIWIGNGAVLKSSSQWQLKGFSKLNNSGNELFIFKIGGFFFYRNVRHSEHLGQSLDP